VLGKIINLIKQVHSCFWKKRKYLKILSQKTAHNLIPVRPRNECGLVTKPAAWILKQRRPGLPNLTPAWVNFSPKPRWPSIWIGWSRVDFGGSKPWCGRSPETLAHSYSHPVSVETESEAVSRPEVWHHPLARSPACDVHPKVSVPPSSQLATVPWAEICAHNTRLSPVSGDATGLLLGVRSSSGNEVSPDALTLRVMISAISFVWLLRFLFGS
jgi:hypothetical protein